MNMLESVGNHFAASLTHFPIKVKLWPRFHHPNGRENSGGDLGEILPCTWPMPQGALLAKRDNFTWMNKSLAGRLWCNVSPYIQSTREQEKLEACLATTSTRAALGKKKLGFVFLRIMSKNSRRLGY